MPDKKINWFKIAATVEELPWQNNELCVGEAGGKKFTLARVQNSVHAFAYKCPHASGILADGFLDAAGNIVCPLHRYKFNISSGRNITGEGYFLPHYPVEHRADGLYIGFEEKGWLNF